MAEEIRFARACGADGVVLGVLTPDGEVDETRTAQLVRELSLIHISYRSCAEGHRGQSRGA